MPRGHASRRALRSSASAAVFQTTRRRVRGAIALAALAAVAVETTAGATPAAAQPVVPVTLTFSSLSGLDPSAGINYVANCYVEGGLVISVAGTPCGDPYALGTYTPADPTGYTGSPALFNNMGFSLDFATTTNLPFSMLSIDLAPILLGSLAPTPMTVTFMGMLMGGGSVSQSLIVPAGVTGLTTYALTGFTNLASLSITPDAPDYSVQIDNVSAAVTTPEPATVVLLGAGLAGLAAATRVSRRRRATH